METRSMRIAIWFSCVVVIALLPILFKLFPAVGAGKEICWREVGGASDVTLIGIVVIADGFGRLCSRFLADGGATKNRKRLISMMLGKFLILIVGLGWFTAQLFVDEANRGKEVACSDVPLSRAIFDSVYLLFAFPSALGAIFVEEANQDAPD